MSIIKHSELAKLSIPELRQHLVLFSALLKRSRKLLADWKPGTCLSRGAALSEINKSIKTLNRVAFHLHLALLREHKTSVDIPKSLIAAVAWPHKSKKLQLAALERLETTDEISWSKKQNRAWDRLRAAYGV